LNKRDFKFLWRLTALLDGNIRKNDVGLLTSSVLDFRSRSNKI